MRETQKETDELSKIKYPYLICPFDWRLVCITCDQSSRRWGITFMLHVMHTYNLLKIEDWLVGVTLTFHTPADLVFKWILACDSVYGTALNIDLHSAHFSVAEGTFYVPLNWVAKSHYPTSNSCEVWLIAPGESCRVITGCRNSSACEITNTERFHLKNLIYPYFH